MTADRSLVAVPQPGTLSATEVLQGLNTVRSVLAPDLTDDELRLFAMVATRSGLDPFSKQVYAVKRKGRVTFQTGIDGYRSTGERTGEYRGSEEPEYGPWADKPWGHPESARVGVRRDGRPTQYATAYWDEYVPGEGQDQMWRKMPRNQLAKCAEALAFRKAFPFLLADVYTTEEMDQADSRDAAESRAAEVAALPTARDRLAARRAQLDAEPAQDAPQQPQEPEAPTAAADEPVEAREAEEAQAREVCGAESDPALGSVEHCALAPGHEQDGSLPRRHQSAAGTVWPIAKGSKS